MAKRTETGSDSFCQKKKNVVEERKMEQREWSRGRVED